MLVLFQVLLRLQRLFKLIMENFRKLKKLRISDNAESEDDAWSWPGVIRVLPKDAEDMCHTPDVKWVVVVTPDDIASSLVQYIDRRYPEVTEWMVETPSGETGVDRKEPKKWKKSSSSVKGLGGKSCFAVERHKPILWPGLVAQISTFHRM
ncbi:uncharacterized protein LOC111619210 [Centruroides sculpturatus]|uniref:uncharacterized protein LOC111619210 n=1 Tax=Centruroides sculpturatus TaxID=218467 RepID=UPI000C6DE09B|nr:uncharacterized protein LOC111619210 [Centruroides sculpturatus]